MTYNFNPDLLAKTKAFAADAPNLDQIYDAARSQGLNYDQAADLWSQAVGGNAQDHMQVANKYYSDTGKSLGFASPESALNAMKYQLGLQDVQKQDVAAFDPDPGGYWTEGGYYDTWQYQQPTYIKNKLQGTFNPLVGYQNPRSTDWNPEGGTYDPGVGFNGQYFNWLNENRPKMQMNLAADVMAGKNATLDDVINNSYESNEIIPANPAANALREQFDPVYGVKANQQLMNQLGSSLKLTPQEIEQVARLKMADMYQSGVERGGGAAFHMGGSPVAQQYSDQLLKYAEAKYGNQLPADARQKVLDTAKGVDTGFGNARAIEAQNENGFFNDIAPLAAMALSLIPGMQPIGMALNATMALKNDNLAGAALSFLPMAGGAVSEAIKGATGLTGAGLNAATSGAMGALSTGLQGGDFSGMLKGGAMGGLTSYGGSLLSPELATMGLDPAQIKALTNTAAGTLSGLAAGKDLDDSLTGAAIRGLTGYGLSQAK